MINGTTNRLFKHIVYNVETGEVEEVYKSSDKHEDSKDDQESVVIDIEPIEDDQQITLNTCVNHDSFIYNRKGKLIKSKTTSTTNKLV